MVHHEQPVGGIIPARAGFTYVRHRGGAIVWDHPRSRGVYSSQISPGTVRPGSSPLARGLLSLAHIRQVRWRIIPARAGFTSTSAFTTVLTRDHPRSRGVYDQSSHSGLGHQGSSPLARGLPAPLRRTLQNIRIIPARAGFTQHVQRVTLALRDHPRSRGVYYYTAWPWVVDTGSSPLARGLPVGERCFASCCGIIPARAGFTLGDRRDSNGGPPYQGAFAFTGDLGTARLSCGSVVAGQRSTTTPSPV